MSAQETLRSTFPDVDNPPYPKVSYGLPFYDACAKHVTKTLHSKRPYIIASKTLSERTEFLKQLQKALGSELVGTWIGIPNHTPIDALIPIIKDMRAKQADCLITLGGGSISDGAKLISFCLANDVHTKEDAMPLPRITDDGKIPTDYSHTKPCTVPVICIPISLSGGEYSRFAGTTDPATNFKYQFTHPSMYPALVILDPHLTRSTPMATWLSSGVRSVDHCVEGFLSSNAHPEGDKAVRKALPMLVTGLLNTKSDPDDQEARLHCQLGSNLSLTLLELGVMCGASHGIGHQLGPMGVAHGDTSCVLMPAVCKFNAPVNGTKQEELKAMLCGLQPVQEVLKKASVDQEKADLGDVLRAIFNALGMPKSLKDVGVGRDKLDVLAQGCLKEVFIFTNPRSLKTKGDILQILNMVVE